MQEKEKAKVEEEAKGKAKEKEKEKEEVDLVDIKVEEDFLQDPTFSKQRSIASFANELAITPVIVGTIKKAIPQAKLHPKPKMMPTKKEKLKK